MDAAEQMRLEDRLSAREISYRIINDTVEAAEHENVKTLSK